MELSFCVWLISLSMALVSGKEPAYQCRRHKRRGLDLIPGSRRPPGGGNGNPLQDSCHGQRSLMGYSPWDHKESDTTE